MVIDQGDSVAILLSHYNDLIHNLKILIHVRDYLGRAKWALDFLHVRNYLLLSCARQSALRDCATTFCPLQQLRNLI